MVIKYFKLNSISGWFWWSTWRGR